MNLTVLVPCRNEIKYIKRCLDSVVNTTFPVDRFEVLFVDGLSEDGTADVIKEYASRFSFIKLLINENRTVPFAMNLGIQASSGEIIIRLDAHSSYPKDYFEKLVFWSNKLDADNVGCVWRTEVIEKNLISMAIRNVLSDPFGVGNALYRTGIDKVTEVDTVPFGCYKRDVFKKYGLYNTFLTRNQDYELNQRIKRGGGKIYLVPELEITYYARSTFSALFKNNYANGRWNILTPFFIGSSHAFSLRHFVPSVFVVSLFLPLIVSLLYSPLALISVFVALLYCFVMGLRAIKITTPGTTPFHIFAAFIVLHCANGMGTLAGFLSLFPAYSHKKSNTAKIENRT